MVFSMANIIVGPITYNLVYTQTGMHSFSQIHVKIDRDDHISV